MVAPLDIIKPIHNAFRKGLIDIDDSAYQIAKNGGDLSPVLERLKSYNEFLIFHADGEELAVFPAVDKIAPQVAQAFLMDHRELDTMTEGTAKVVGAANELDAARATASLWTHLRIHLDKEDTFLYPLLRKGIPEAEQAPIVGTMASRVPHDEMPRVIGFLMANMTNEERETANRVWMALMPEQVFAGVKELVKGSVTSADWSDLTRRIPEMA